MISDVDHLFLYSAMWMSFFEKCLFSSSAYFLIRWFGFFLLLLLNCISISYIIMQYLTFSCMLVFKIKIFWRCFIKRQILCYVTSYGLGILIPSFVDIVLFQLQTQYLWSEKIYVLSITFCQYCLLSCFLSILVEYESESESEVAQSCPTLCDPMDCSPPGSSVHGIPQARILEWVAIVWERVKYLLIYLGSISLMFTDHVQYNFLNSIEFWLLSSQNLFLWLYFYMTFVTFEL